MIKQMKGSTFFLISSDPPFRSALADKVRSFGGTVVDEMRSRCEAAVILVDVRSDVEGMLDLCRDVRSDLNAAEIVLINRTGNLDGSMAGMRAGAMTELLVPLDLDRLRSTLKRAWASCRKKMKRSRTGALRDFLERSMAAAAFAQVGEFDSARDFMDGADQPKLKK